MKLKRDPAIKKLLLLLLLLSLLLLCGCVQTAEEPPVPEPAAETPPAETPAAETPPAETPAATPCPHIWEDGVCSLCGEACSHVWEGGVCTRCAAVCPHEAHNSNAVCLVCGEQRWHSYDKGLCTGCGREPLLFTEMLPNEYLQPAEHAGTCLTDTLSYSTFYEYPMSVYLPYGYDENSHYNLVILLLGDNNHAPDCTETVHEYHDVELRLSYIYDHMLEDHLCEPFILVGIEHVLSLHSAENVNALLRNDLLPQLARDYATWIDGDDEAAIEAARDHIALCGLSRGAAYVMNPGMRSCADFFGSFCCMSRGLVTTSDMRKADSELFEQYGANAVVFVWGLRDPFSWRGDHRCCVRLTEMADCLTDGENVFSLGVDDGHNWATWSAGLFAALQFMF